MSVAIMPLRSEAEVEISIVMPCLNEAETLRGCIEEAQAAIAASGATAEIIVADNGSTDGSQRTAQEAGACVVHVPERGYGNALMGGIRAARGRYVLMGDADGSYDFRELSTFLAPLRNGGDLVMGCRLPAGGGRILPGAMPWKHRWIGNPALSSLGKLFFRASVDDFHCGLRAFRRDAILGLDLRCTGMEFASEMIVKAIVSRLRMTQVPITLRPDRRSRPPHLRSWRDGWRHLRFMLLYSPKWLFFIPGTVVFTAGVVGFIRLMFGPWQMGDIILDTNTLLVCAAAILVGFQALFFAVYTKAFAVHAGLLRPDPRIDRLFKMSITEWSAGLGACLVLLGFGYLVFALIAWESVGFGPLSYPNSLRVVIPGVTAIALGFQTIFSGFALAVLGLPRK